MTADVVCIEAEGALLGAAMLAPAQAAAALDGIVPDDFADPRHRDVYGAIRCLLDQGVPPDPVAVLAEMRRAGTLPSTADRGPGGWLHGLVQACPAAAMAGYYRRAVAEHTLRRRTREGFERIAQAAERGSLDNLRQVVGAELASVVRLLDRCDR